MNLLAIDPGYDRCGVAVVDTTTKQVTYSTCIETSKKDTHEKRLTQVYTELEMVVLKYKPGIITLETLFFSVNKKSALAVAEARGVILLLAGQHDLPVLELSPQEVKLSIAGVGNASKEQVQKMVALTLKIDTDNKLDDELDAIALGISAVHTLHIKNLLK